MVGVEGGVASGKGLLVRWMGGWILRDGEVAAVDVVDPAFRLVTLDLPAPMGGEPGDKIQVLLPSDDCRTYTPIGDDRRPQLLVYLHGPSPAGTWARALSPGQAVRFLAPRRSLRMPAGALVLVGDETSIAVAAAYARARPGRVHAVLATSVDVSAACAAVGLAATVVPAGDDAALVSAVARVAAEHPGAHLGLTGNGEVIARVRPALRPSFAVAPTVKTYWLPGRAGLD